MLCNQARTATPVCCVTEIRDRLALPTPLVLMVRDRSSAARCDSAGEEALTKLVLESTDLRTLLADLRTVLVNLRTLQATSTSSVAEARWRCEKEDKWTRRRFVVGLAAAAAAVNDPAGGPPRLPWRGISGISESAVRWQLRVE
ncbi:hypothetical protein ACLB2K_006431 [Fragaria x ananassa]